MGWPRSNEGFRLYRERDGGYIVVNMIDGPDMGGRYDACVNVYPGPGPSLAGGAVTMAYLRDSGCKRVSWPELPPDWQRAIRNRMAYVPIDYQNPDRIRGFWRVGAQPRPESLADSGPGGVRTERGPCSRES